MAHRADNPRGSDFGRTPVLAINVVYAVALAGLSMMSAPPRVPVLSQTDWLAHGLAYFVQTLLLFPLFRRMTTPRSAVVVAAATAMVFGVVMEAVQLVMPGRFFELQDLLANTTGIAVGALILGGFGLWWQVEPEDSSG